MRMRGAGGGKWGRASNSCPLMPLWVPPLIYSFVINMSNLRHFHKALILFDVYTYGRLCHIEILQCLSLILFGV